MPISTRMLRRRMKSVANTRKITKAMELVAGAKMRKAVALTLASRDYATTIQALVERVRALVPPVSHPLFFGRATSRSTLLAILASDRGLCGGFNTQLIKKALNVAASRTEEIRVVTIGRRAELAIKRAGFPLFASFEAISNAPSSLRAFPIGKLLSQEFFAGRADRVFLVFMDFQSALTQIATVKQLLPIISESELPLIHMPFIGASADFNWTPPSEATMFFEPNVQSILDVLLPRLLETQVYQALLESSASEHSSRMLAMRSATENASEMLQDLSFTYNQARQATITREISEISAGKAVIE